MYLKKRFEISKCAKQVNYWKFKDLQIWSHTFFDIWNGFWDISEKLFLKKLCQMLRFPKTSWIGSNYVVFCLFFSFFSFIAGNLVSSGQHSRDNVSAKLGVGKCFLDISNPCISKTVGHIKTNMEVLGRLRPHFYVYKDGETIRKYDIRGMTYFKTSVPFWEH